MNSNATPVNGGFVGGAPGWDKSALARAQEQKARRARATANDFHAGEF